MLNQRFMQRNGGGDLQERGVTIKTLVKAVELMELLMAQREGVSLKDLSKALGQNPSTIYHLVSTMRQVGLLQQDPEEKTYRLGLKAFQIGQAALQHLDVVQRAQPPMKELARITGEGISLVQYQDQAPVYVLHIDSSRTIGMRHRPGGTIPLHCTGSGKVFLSSLPDEELERKLPGLQLSRFTAATITDTEKLRAEIGRVRTQGYAIDNEEVEDGLVCIAAPIRNHQGEIVGSVSLSGPSSRIQEKLDELIQRTCETARAASFHR